MMDLKFVQEVHFNIFLILFKGMDKTMKIWETRTGALLKSIEFKSKPINVIFDQDAKII